MKLSTRYYLQVPTATIALTVFALINLLALSIYLWFNNPSNIPQYLYFILSFAAFYVGFSIFKIVWWNVFHKGWLEISIEEITFTKYFKPVTVKTKNILDVNIPGLDEPESFSECINIFAIASHLQQTTLKLIIPLVFFQGEDKEMLPLLLSSVTK